MSPAERPSSLRVAAVQFAMHEVASFDAFAARCEQLTSVAAESGARVVVFPEFVTHALLPLIPGTAREKVWGLSAFTSQYVELFSRLAHIYSVDVLGGTHVIAADGVLRNVAHLFSPDGRVRTQVKVHPTPWEREKWGVSGGDDVEVFELCGVKAAILICYDVEFPELVRIARGRGARLLLVPYNTENRAGHVRVRTCAHARCIENNVYVVLAGMGGQLLTPGWSETYYARSSVLTPSDTPFARDGIAAEAGDSQDAVVVADLDFDLLVRSEQSGAVRTWPDRRRDVYSVHFVGGSRDETH
jgi:predicted amidohydrolase